MCTSPGGRRGRFARPASVEITEELVALGVRSVRFIDGDCHRIVAALERRRRIIDPCWLRRGPGPARIAGMEARRDD